ncbi:MAG: hypothetical protein LC101_03240, partial [Flavobacteriales bacterium]|nr:hypothetical protein [Flavobacteriales bacterium]
RQKIDSTKVNNPYKTINSTQTELHLPSLGYVLKAALQSDRNYINKHKELYRSSSDNYVNESDINVQSF